ANATCPIAMKRARKIPVPPSEACVRMIIHVPYDTLDPPHTAFFAVGRSWPNDGKCRQNDGGARGPGVLMVRPRRHSGDGASAWEERRRAEAAEARKAEKALGGRYPCIRATPPRNRTISAASCSAERNHKPRKLAQAYHIGRLKDQRCAMAKCYRKRKLHVIIP